MMKLLAIYKEDAYRCLIVKLCFVRIKLVKNKVKLQYLFKVRLSMYNNQSKKLVLKIGMPTMLKSQS